MTSAFKAALALDEIKSIRAKNNDLWMAILSLAVRYAPQETKQLLKEIEAHDNAIGEKLKCLQESLPD